MKLHRRRLIDHIQIVTADVDASRRFYQAVLAPLGIAVTARDGYFYADELFVSGGSPLTGRCLIAFQALDADQVAAFYAGGSLPADATTAPRRAALPFRLLRRVPARSRRQQYRGRLSWPPRAFGPVGRTADR